MPLDSPEVPDGDPTRQEMLHVLIESGLYTAADFDAEGNLHDAAVRFDAEAAMYWFAPDWHSGQDSNLYAVLSTSQYKPGASMHGVADESKDVQDCYGLFKQSFIHN